MSELLLRLEREDTQHCFVGPMPDAPAPLPVNFSTIRTRLCALQYTSRAQFVEDLRAMFHAVCSRFVLCSLYFDRPLGTFSFPI